MRDDTPPHVDVLQFTGTDVRQALGEGARLLAQAHIAGAGADARRLLAHALMIAPLALIVTPERVLTHLEAQAFADVLVRRLRHEPVARIVGVRGFYGRDFIVTPATLDPRPETETLIETALDMADKLGGRDRALTIVDIGTGSGAILVTLLAELPLALGIGIDLSADALQIAQRNAAQHEVEDRIRWVEGRTFAGEAGPFDLVVSNPPYIPTRDLETLEPDVRLFDPTLALDGGADGLTIYREIAAGLPQRLRRGAVVVEVGQGQAQDVAGMLRAAWGADSLSAPLIVRDLGGVDRCVAVATQF